MALSKQQSQSPKIKEKCYLRVTRKIKQTTIASLSKMASITIVLAIFRLRRSGIKCRPRIIKRVMGLHNQISFPPRTVTKLKYLKTNLAVQIILQILASNSKVNRSFLFSTIGTHYYSLHQKWNIWQITNQPSATTMKYKKYIFSTKKRILSSNFFNRTW